MKNIFLKDDNGKLWVEVIIATFLDAILIVDVLTASNNEVKLVESETVHFARLKSSSRFEKITRNSTAITRISKFCLLFAP